MKELFLGSFVGSDRTLRHFKEVFEALDVQGTLALGTWSVLE